MVVAAGDRTREAGNHGGAGAGQPRRRLPAGGARRMGQALRVAQRRAARELGVSRPHGGAAAARRLGRARDLRRGAQRPAVAVARQRRRRGSALHRLRERREPAALARGGAPQGDLRAAVARRVAMASRPPAPDRERPARGHWRRGRRRRRRLERPAAAAAGVGGVVRLARLRVRGRRHLRHGIDLRHRAGASRDTARRQRRAEGEQPRDDRGALDAVEGAPRRASGDVARAARRRGPLSEHAAQPPKRRGRVRQPEPDDLPHRSRTRALRTGPRGRGVRRRAAAPRSRRCSAEGSARATSSSRASTTRTHRAIQTWDAAARCIR